MNETGKITAIDGLHLRQLPNDESPILYKMKYDSIVKIEGKVGNWLKVRTAWGERGYLYSQYVTVIQTGPEPAEIPPEVQGPPEPLFDWVRILYVIGGTAVFVTLGLIWRAFNS